MIDLKQVERLNKMPINQYASQLLKKAKQHPEPDTLHLYQLITWGLENNQVEIRDITEPYAAANLMEAAEQAQVILSPQKQMDLLTKMGPVPEASWAEISVLLTMKTAKEAAQYLAEQLREALKSLMPPEIELEQ